MRHFGIIELGGGVNQTNLFTQTTKRHIYMVRDKNYSNLRNMYA